MGSRLKSCLPLFKLGLVGKHLLPQVARDILDRDKVIRPQDELFLFEKSLLGIFDLGKEGDDRVGKLAEDPEHPALGLEISFQVGLVDDLVTNEKFQFLPQKRPEILVDEKIGGVLFGEVSEPPAQESRRRLAFLLPAGRRGLGKGRP